MRHQNRCILKIVNYPIYLIEVITKGQNSLNNGLFSLFQLANPHGE